DIDPENARTWASKGSALYEMDRFTEAVSCFDRALSINETPMMLNNKGFALLSDDKLDEAIQAFDKAIEMDEEYPEAWNNKGIALSRMEEHVYALECFERALGIEPGFRDAIRNRDAAVRRLEKEVEKPEEKIEEDRSGIEEAEKLEEEEIAGEEFRCPACDAIGNIDDKFCDKCGTEFKTEDKEEAIIEKMEDVLAPPKKKKKKGKKGKKKKKGKGKGKDKDKSEEISQKEFVNALVGVPGLGFSKSEAIYEAGFKTFKDLEKAKVEDLTEVKGISERLAKNIKKVYK
ncbi:MAG: tetratricopeptide repeat protein, partial [Thermoplasmata archaeon]|nr:tetratricopeptide repeat protein [Thermoplasmata archaeon]